MSQETTDNFWRVWQSFQWSDPEPVFYRLYHDADGRPVIYSMENLDMPYVEVDQAAYLSADYRVKVIDGKIIKLRPSVQTKKLIPGETGTACDPRDVLVVVSQQCPHVNWMTRTYEQD